MHRSGPHQPEGLQAARRRRITRASGSRPRRRCCAASARTARRRHVRGHAARPAARCLQPAAHSLQPAAGRVEQLRPCRPLWPDHAGGAGAASLGAAEAGVPRPRRTVLLRVSRQGRPGLQQPRPPGLAPATRAQQPRRNRAAHTGHFVECGCGRQPATSAPTQPAAGQPGQRARRPGPHSPTLAHTSRDPCRLAADAARGAPSRVRGPGRCERRWARHVLFRQRRVLLRLPHAPWR